MIHRSGVDSKADKISETFNMLGSTGNIYVRSELDTEADADLPQTVSMGTKPSCDCPDNLKGNSPCKHIIFILWV